MIRTTTGHPTRALRGVVLLLLLWVTYRAPAMLDGFEAAIAAAAGELSAEVVDPARALQPSAAPPIRTAITPRPRPLRLFPQRPPRPVSVRIDRRVVRVDDDPGGNVVVLAVTMPPEPRHTANAVVAATAGDYAAAAYAHLAAGDRRGAARLFDAALAAGGDPRAAAWRSQRETLTRRWSGSAYTIVRSGGSSGVAVAPVLGGGQSGAALAWAPDPLAVRPLALTLRGTIAHDDGGRSALGAVGIAWHPFAGVTLAAERLLPIGPAARGDWAVRVAGGSSRSAGVIDASTYGEAGAVGPVVYAAAQAHLGASFHRHGIAFGPGVGGWASIQHASRSTVNRLDIGPGLAARAGWLSLSADYRFRIAGNAAPGSGPVMTLAAAF